MLLLSIRPTVDARVRAAWQEQVTAAVKTPGLLPELLQRRQELLPRFGAYYTQLRALPRRMRRALQRKWKHSLAGVALLLALGQEPVLAATINVTGGCSLINAITAANTDTATGGCPQGSGADTIRLPVGSTQTLTTINNSTFGPTGLPVISSAITIEGRNSTIRRDRDDPDLFRIFAINGTGNLTLKDITISGGVTTGFFPNNRGGGVLNEGTLTLMNSTVSESGTAFPGDSGAGGGVFNAGSATITNSTISGDLFIGGGGGIFNAGSATITNSTISGSGEYNAGGGVSNSGTLAITGSKISGDARGSGGGVSNSGTLTITNSTISDSSARISGGGVYNGHYSTLTIINSTISGNEAEFYGGGISNSGVATITNSTISGNSSFNYGGGVINSGALTLVRTLVSGNTAPNGPEIDSFETLTTNAFNLFGHDGNAGVVGFTPGITDVIPTVPLSAILNPTVADNGGPTLTHALVSGSPAVDAVATGCPPPSTDQRGFLRPADGDSIPGALCDIGAFEFDALPPVLNDLVTFVPLPSTFRTTTNTTGCPAGFVGTFSFTAQLTDKSTSPPLSDLTVEVNMLSNGNLLQNADGGPGGVGATLTVAEQGQFADGVLSPGEVVDVPLVICLQQTGPFTFFVDVLGVEE